MNRMTSNVICLVLIALLFQAWTLALNNTESDAQKQPKILPKRVQELEHKISEHEKTIEELVKYVETVKAESDISCSEPMGCYRDDQNRMFDGEKFDFGQMTHEICVKYCSGRRYTYAALQYRKECFCGSSFNAQYYYKVDDSECNEKCRGNVNQACGGIYRNTVFEVSNCN